jgi:hypothetical protein
MADLGGYLGSDGPVFDFLARDRQADMAFQLQHQGQPLRLSRLKDDASKAVQTVLFVSPASGSDVFNTAGGLSASTGVVVMGLPTLDIRNGDIFMLGSTRYTVRFVDATVPNKIVATCEANQ